jgi:hypothetical protein
MNAADARAKARQAEHPGPLNALSNALSGTWTFEPIEAYEEWGRLIEESRQLFDEEKGVEYVAALRGQVTALQGEIAALRDLLDLKTREVLLRDKLTVEHKQEVAPEEQ